MMNKKKDNLGKENLKLIAVSMICFALAFFIYVQYTREYFGMLTVLKDFVVSLFIAYCITCGLILNSFIKPIR